MVYEQVLRQGGDAMLREASACFEGEGRLPRALRQPVHRLDAEQIPNDLIGDLALAGHGYPRLTEDVALLLAPAGLERFQRRLRDLVDVQDLIIQLDLSESFGEALDPSVRGAYLELWEAAYEGKR